MFLLWQLDAALTYSYILNSICFYFEGGTKTNKHFVVGSTRLGHTAATCRNDIMSFLQVCCMLESEMVRLEISGILCSHINPNTIVSFFSRYLSSNVCISVKYLVVGMNLPNSSVSIL